MPTILRDVLAHPLTERLAGRFVLDLQFAALAAERSRSYCSSCAGARRRRVTRPLARR